MKRERVIPIVGIAVLLLLVAACGDGSSTPFNPNPVSITLSAAPSHLGASETYQFTATVTGGSSSQVLWSLASCTDCGTISATGLYTAPSIVHSDATVAIVATAAADAKRSASATLLLKALSIVITPSVPVVVAPGATREFQATLDHDPLTAGVTWSLSGSGCSGEACGTLSNVTTTSVIFHAPPEALDPPDVKLTATSITDGTKSAWGAITVSDNSYRLTGRYALLLYGWNESGVEAVAGHLNANGDGTFTGVWDANRTSTPDIAQSVSGTYSVQPDGRGTLTINAGLVTWSYLISVDSTQERAQLLQVVGEQGGGGSYGYLLRQHPAEFTAEAIARNYVTGLSGTATGSHVGAVGRFTIATSGAVNGGVMDLSWSTSENVGMFPNPVTVSGSFSVPDSNTGRGTATLNVAGSTGSAQYKFAYYIVSSDRLLLVETDVRGYNAGVLTPTLLGEANAQKSSAFTNASLNGAFTFGVTDVIGGWFTPETPKVRVGLITPNGTGGFTIAFDENSGVAILANSTATDNYSVAANGRVTWNKPEPAVGFLSDENRGYFITADGDGAGFGGFEPQLGSPFQISSFAGKFLLTSGAPPFPGARESLGWMTIASDGTLAGLMYSNAGTGTTSSNFTGALTIASDGRAILTLNTVPASVSQKIVLRAVSSDRLWGVMTMNDGDTAPALLELRRAE